MTAIADAIVLVNCIYDIEKVAYESIQAALSHYQAQRFSHVEYQMGIGKTFAEVMFGQENRTLLRQTERAQTLLVCNRYLFSVSSSTFFLKKNLPLATIDVASIGSKRTHHAQDCLQTAQWSAGQEPHENGSLPALGRVFDNSAQQSHDQDAVPEAFEVIRERAGCPRQGRS